MSNFEDDIKKRRWNELKASVGTMAQQEKLSGKSMTIDELLLNIKNVSFQSLVRQQRKNKRICAVMNCSKGR